MAGAEKDNSKVERVLLGGGYADVEFEPEGKAYLGLFEESGKPYIRASFDNSANIDDLIGALQRLKKKVAKSEE